MPSIMWKQIQVPAKNLRLSRYQVGTCIISCNSTLTQIGNLIRRLKWLLHHIESFIIPQVLGTHVRVPLYAAIQLPFQQYDVAPLRCILASSRERVDHMHSFGSYQQFKPERDASGASVSHRHAFVQHISAFYNSDAFKAKAKDAAPFFQNIKVFVFGRPATLENIVWLLIHFIEMCAIGWFCIIYDFMNTQLTYNQTPGRGLGARIRRDPTIWTGSGGAMIEGWPYFGRSVVEERDQICVVTHFVDPTDVFAGLKSNSSSLRRVDDIYNIYGVFCQPESMSARNPASCARNHIYQPILVSVGGGIPKLFLHGLFLTPTVAAAISRLAHHLETVSLLPGVPPFRTIIGIGHSTGSGLLTFTAIVDGARSPFAAFILTSALSDSGAAPAAPSSLIPSARDDTPLRWSALDPGYITAPNRSIFYPRRLRRLFDAFTRDVGSVGMLAQTGVVSIAAQHYAGRVAKVLGAADQFICADERCEDVAALSAAEGVLWPAAESFELVLCREIFTLSMNMHTFYREQYGQIMGYLGTAVSQDESCERALEYTHSTRVNPFCRGY
ncbi:hypothetical protein B0H14DRAFT_3742212 [Mycena olivaceomarginata]|nr:hypothetical protein B0H14DRAFT_3742212 [Mycena olivaceomarginata]